MQHIALSESVYHAVTTLAAERQIAPEDLIAQLVAQEAWEEHALQSIAAYEQEVQAGTHQSEAMTDDDFLAWLHAVTTDANL